MLNHRLFITATDTGVGKTLTTAGLAICLRRRGHAVRALKPVASGGIPSEDTLELARATGRPLEEVTGWAFREPAAPPVAARAEGRTLDLEEIARWVQDREQTEVLLVEGVGGLLCPLTETTTIADLIARLDYPVLIVARRALGTLNHTLLTAEAAQQRGLRIQGILITETQPVASLAEATAVDELRRRLKARILGVIPYCPSPDPMRVADNLDAADILTALGWEPRN